MGRGWGMTWQAADHRACRKALGARWRSAAKRDTALSGALHQRMRRQERTSARPSIWSTVASTGQWGVGEGRTSASGTDHAPQRKIWSIAVALRRPLVGMKCVGVCRGRAGR